MLCLSRLIILIMNCALIWEWSALSKIKRFVLSVTFILFVFTALFTVITIFTENSLCYTFAVTFGTTFYHFAMRLFVGKVTKQSFNYESFWFKEKGFEKKLYKAIGVKKWKGKMPSYNSETYMMKEIPLAEVINTMCRNEVIHEVIALLSFVPISFSAAFGEFAVFVITSILACLFDLIFVVMQRYNRPRVVRLMLRQSKRKDSE